MIRIALAQINPTVGDLKGNRDLILEYIYKAKELGAEIAVFPELAITGYPPEDLLLKPHFIRDNIKILKSITKKIQGITVIIGFVDKDAKGIYNAAAIVTKSTVRGVYRKKILPNYSVFDEKRYFCPGEDKGNIVFHQNSIIYAVNICEDIWDPNGPVEKQVKAGARILINISASPFHAGKMAVRKKTLSAKARKANAFLCYVNLIGGQDELVFDGGSFVLDPDGKVKAVGEQFVEDLVVADIDIGRGRKKIKGRRVPGAGFRKLTKAEEVYKALVLGTRDYVHKNGFTKVVLGLSGGIDSSLVAAIASDALGPENVIGISMPSEYTSKGTRKDSKKLADNLNIGFKEVLIKDLFKGYKTAFRDLFGRGSHGIVEENIQARIRGNLLMAFSNNYGWLVLSTGNKSESSVGYCTLYGDMVGGFSVIKDVPKVLVYELSDLINRSKGKDVIPRSIIDRPPTAELRKGQKDTDSLPPYPVLDPVLRMYIEEDKSFDDIVKKGKRGKVRRIIQMVDSSEYKRRQSSPGIRITPKAFGKDRRLPITNRYREPGR